MANEIYKIFLAEDDETIVHIDGGGGGGGGEPAQYLKDATKTSNKLTITKKDGSTIATNVVPDISGSAGQALVINGAGNDLVWGPAPTTWGTTTGKPFTNVGNLLDTTGGTLNVKVVDVMDPDKTNPMSSKGVFQIVGNIQALLDTI